MPKRRNSRKPTTSDKAHHQPPTRLRRSPRFLHQNSQDPDTHNPKPTKDHKYGTQKASKKPRQPGQSSSLCAIPAFGSRRCPRFSKRVDRFSSPRRSLRPQVIDKSKKPTTSATAYPEPLTPHRRSPRFLHQNHQDLNTLNPKPKEDHKDGTQKASKKPRKPDQSSSLCAIAVLGSRRSPRFSKRVDGFPSPRQSLKPQVIDKSNHLESKEDRKRTSSPVNKKCRSNMRDVLNKVEGEVGVVIGLRAQRGGGGIERSEEGRVSRKRKRGEEEVERNASRRSLRLQVIDKSNHLELKKKDKKTSSGPVIKKCRDNKLDLLNKFEGEVGVVIGLRVWRGGDGIKRSEEGRVSRKWKRGEEEVERNANVKGWTREQEIALQRAYFAAKPTPNFWKKVSKLVFALLFMFGSF